MGAVARSVESVGQAVIGKKLQTASCCKEHVEYGDLTFTLLDITCQEFFDIRSVRRGTPVGLLPPVNPTRWTSTDVMAVKSSVYNGN